MSASDQASKRARELIVDALHRIAVYPVISAQTGETLLTYEDADYLAQLAVSAIKADNEIHLYTHRSKKPQ